MAFVGWGVRVCGEVGGVEHLYVVSTRGIPVDVGEFRGFVGRSGRRGRGNRDGKGRYAGGSSCRGVVGGTYKRREQYLWRNLLLLFEECMISDDYQILNRRETIKRPKKQQQNKI